MNAMNESDEQRARRWGNRYGNWMIAGFLGSLLLTFCGAQLTRLEADVIGIADGLLIGGGLIGVAVQGVQRLRRRGRPS